MSTLQGRSDILEFFRRNQIPLYYVSTSTFNVLGADDWINKLSFINTIDSFDGRHPHVFVSPPPPSLYLPGIEAPNNYLLGHPAVADHVRRSGPGGALFMMFDAQAEALAQKLGLAVVSPPSALREYLDNKLMTTRLAERAGIASVPNVLARVDSYRTLREVARGLGPDLVVQLPLGDSGTTTFFISSEADYQPAADTIALQPEVKVMKRIRCRETTLEGCVTRYGTLVGPLMTELVGMPELTPYGGGWCGNEVFGAGASMLISSDIRRQAHRAALAVGEQLRQEGYWGCFGLDFLIDQDDGALYLGELNPRITGVTALTIQMALDQHELPLLLFHLLEWMGVEYAFDVEQFNRRWVAAEQTTSWSQLVMEHLGDGPATLTRGLPAGVWRLQSNGSLLFSRPAFDPRAVADESEAFFLRTLDPGHTTYRGWSVGRLITHGRLISDDYQLTERAKAWIGGFRTLFATSAAAHDLLSTAPTEH